MTEMMFNLIINQSITVDFWKIIQCYWKVFYLWQKRRVRYQRLLFFVLKVLIRNIYKNGHLMKFKSIKKRVMTAATGINLLIFSCLKVWVKEILKIILWKSVWHSISSILYEVQWIVLKSIVNNRIQILVSIKI